MGSSNKTADIRERVLSADPTQVGLSPAGPVWGVVMDTCYAAGSATLIALCDGTASLLFSTGGAVGGEELQSVVREPAVRFVDEAAAHLHRTESARDHDLPGVGEVRFHLLTTEGHRVLTAEEELLEAHRHAAAPLYHAGHRIITQLRLVSEGRSGGEGN